LFLGSESFDVFASGAGAKKKIGLIQIKTSITIKKRNKKKELYFNFVDFEKEKELRDCVGSLAVRKNYHCSKKLF
jgi:hypothetical protein